MTKDKKHLAFVINSMNGGGAEKVTLRHIRQFLARGHKVDLILLRFHGPLLLEIPAETNLFIVDRKFEGNKTRWKCSVPEENIQWIRPSADPFKLFGANLRAKQESGDSQMFRIYPDFRYIGWGVSVHLYFDSEQPDLVFANLMKACVACLIGKRLSRFKPPVVCSIHNPIGFGAFDTKLAKTRMFLRMLPGADRIHAVSSGVAESVTDRLPQIENRVAIIHNPVPVEEIVNLSREDPGHPWLGEALNENSKIVLAAGRFAAQKNFPLLIRAFASIRDETGTRLIILGEGRKRTEMEKLIAELNLKNDVSLPGEHSNPYAFMARADVFAMSSDSEGLPNVLLEALSCNCPVVSTDCISGPREILGDGEWGSLVPVGNESALADAIKQMLSNPFPSKEKRGLRAMDFAPERITAELDSLFDDVIAGKGLSVDVSNAAERRINSGSHLS